MVARLDQLEEQAKLINGRLAGALE
jgi:hypothetical protein